MSYMLLFKNRNGIVMAADTRCTKLGNPTLVNDNSRKIAFDANAKICISILGTSSFNTTIYRNSLFLQPPLQSFITLNINHYLTTLQNGNITFDQFIYFFLKWLISNQYLTITELANFGVTYLTGIILHSNNIAESVEVDITKMCPLIQSQSMVLVRSQLPIVCKYKTYVQTDIEVITGGDKILSLIWRNQPVVAQNFILDCKKAIANYTLSVLKTMAVDTINTIIKRNVDSSIGGYVDCIEMDYSGNYHPTINSSTIAFQNLQNNVMSPSDWHP
jgi:hypothetical protein